jgi:hypothetical protein
MNKANTRNRFYQELDNTEGELPLPNGCTLYWKINEVGGIDYLSDEVGGGVPVWNTALVDVSTLTAAMAHYYAMIRRDAYRERKI